MTTPTDELRALLAKATPSPWATGSGSHWSKDVRMPDGDGGAWCQKPEDAALIVGAVNALPGLLATIDAQREEIARLKAEAEADLESHDALISQIERTHASFDDCEREWTNLHDLGECNVAMARSHSTCAESQENAQKRIAALEAEKAAQRESEQERLAESLVACRQECGRVVHEHGGALSLAHEVGRVDLEPFMRLDALRKEGKP